MRTATIQCDGECGAWTTHRFWAERLIGKPSDGKGYEQLFMCIVCGVPRRYGIAACAGRDMVVINTGEDRDG